MAIYQGSKILSSGATPYSFAKENGFEGTEAEFNALLGRIDEATTREELEAAIAGIPTPDVSAQIGAHDGDEAAHPYILGELTAIRSEHSESVNSLNGTITANATTAENYTNSSVEGLRTELTTGSTIVKAATADGSGNVITTTYETKSDATAKLAEAKSYADSVKNDLLNGAGEAYDTLKELGTLIDENTNAIDALETVAAGKSDKEHTHTKSEITDFPTSMPASDVSAWAKATSKPSYTASEVGAEASGAVSTHNSSTSAHNDIRQLIADIGSKVFIATYGTTTFAEIKAAYDDGAVVICTRADDSVKYILTGLTDTTAYFMGMGMSSNILYRVYVDSTWHAASFTGASQEELDDKLDKTGTLPVANGGTGATTAAAARSALGAAASSHNHSASEITSGTLPVARGGTGATTAAAALTALGAAASSHTHSGYASSSHTHAPANIGAAEFQLIKRRGTGTYGASNPCSISFSIKPDIVFYLGFSLTSEGPFHWNGIDSISGITIVANWPTTYTRGYGFSSVSLSKLFGKRSSTNKKLYWYSENSVGEQHNESDEYYYYLGIAFN